MCKALPGISHGNVNAFTPGIAADEACVVDRIQHLPGPLVGDGAKIGDQRACPSLKSGQSLAGIISLAALVVFAADEHVVETTASGLQTDIMVGVFGIPKQC